ncbi:protein-glutamate methylesterase/protein-glutamine glutaminase [Alteromonas hispanica]|uniref:Protein-glutamate methylesterase/protein-glutamine glutaminase n=1 Tax=Alteromonas hispanica TaxID=315421 RepID=A0A6L9MUK7_9ALTE|nr:chemotaxis response regulator protein-glutamate methylesterase [Alteromonas hispanica]NDW21737.1 chemotaxis-specific protein-glutamate methyltransferase CheB [Alteromonas hispanica]
MIKVLIVDDSALIRSLLKTLLSSESDIHVVGTAPDAYVARDMVNKFAPDVITLDIEMPKVDGITFLSKLMKARPTPVLMISTLTEKGADATLKSLELGAIDYIAKPKIGVKEGMEAYRELIVEKVRLAASTKVAKRHGANKKIKQQSIISGTEKIIAIGASTGGTETIKTFLLSLPANAPAVVITQHMPPGFTTTFANRLNTLCHVKVAEAQGGERLLPGSVYIAPGDIHMGIEKSGADYRTTLINSNRVSGHKPSVDVLFDSVSKAAGKNAVGIIMTGMGKDGAAGLLAMRNSGAFTIAQNEQSCVVFGMPGEAIKLDAVDVVCDINDIPQVVSDYLKKSGSGSRL